MGGEEPVSAVREIDFPTGVSALLTEVWNIEQLHPPQAEAVPLALSGKNLLLAIPTASGKSLVAYLAMFQKLLVESPNSRAFYLVPLKALATEKVEELREAGDHLGLKVGMAVGDRTGETVSLDDADIIVATSEKFDSLLRNRPNFLDKVSIVVADEIHLIHDVSRGPTMEVNLARVRLEKPEAQIIALSATIGNAQELADWLDADLVISDWRPVLLRYGTVHDNLVEPRKQVGPKEEDLGLPPPFTIDAHGDEIRNILHSTVQDNGQVLVFRGTRRNAESSASKLGTWMRKKLEYWTNNPNEAPSEMNSKARLESLSEIADQVASSEESTAMSEKLVEALRGGIAFHHAGLTSSHRRVIETAFRNRIIFAICATPTLAAGVNLPARRVLVRDLNRWQNGLNQMLPRMEVHQMLGRAGRPRYDSIGDAWLYARSIEHADELSERYFKQGPEDVDSKLATDPAMRMHVLSAIATGGQQNRDAIRRFFGRTFLATKMDAETLENRIDEIISWLAHNDFIVRVGEDEALSERLRSNTEHPESEFRAEEWDDEMPSWAQSASNYEGVEVVNADDNVERKKGPRRPAMIGFERADKIVTTEPESSIPDSPAMVYAATAFGERVSRLYLDPLSGLIIRDGLRRAREILCRIIEDRSVSPWALLHLVACTPDFLPMWPRGKQFEILEKKVAAMSDQVLLESYELHNYGYMQEATTLAKSAWCLEHWIEEESLRSIESTLGVAPGDVRVRVDHASWLLSAAREICLHDEEISDEISIATGDLIECVEITRKRVMNGCREDLLSLIAIRGVGRVRARTLANHGYRTALEICSISKSSQQKLADEKGWSPQLVSSIMTAANRAIQTHR